jgi:hypothetical protein
MSKINKKKDKIALTRDEPIAISDGYPVFSFRYMTTANKYTFKHFGNNMRDAHAAYESLHSRLYEISNHKWWHWYDLGYKSNGGLEMINAHQLRFSPAENSMLDDKKVIVLKFYRGKYRIIGLKQENNDTLFVIGFDFDFSAYDHG